MLSEERIVVEEDRGYMVGGRIVRVETKGHGTAWAVGVLIVLALLISACVAIVFF